MAQPAPLSARHSTIRPASRRPSPSKPTPLLDPQLTTQDWFISYARYDALDFVRVLAERLRGVLSDEEAQHPVWFDHESIAIAETVSTRIRDGIAGAHYFVYVMTPKSVASEYCQFELEVAKSLGKHIIPVLRLEFDLQDLDAHVRDLNWLEAKGPDPTQSAARLQEKLEDHVARLDEAYVRKHTEITLISSLWACEHRPTRRLLVGEPRRLAEEWMSREFRPPRQPPVALTDLQAEFICESRKNAEGLMTDAFLCASNTARDQYIQGAVRNSLSRRLVTSSSLNREASPGISIEQVDRRRIASADNFLFFVSPDSLASTNCKRLLLEAQRFNKRIIPLLVRPTERPWPDPIESLDYIDFTDNEEQADEDRDIGDLLNEIKADRAYYRQHKVLLTKALAWQERASLLQTKHPDGGVTAPFRGFYLRGYALEMAQAWLRTNQDRQRSHPPTQLHERFVQASMQQQSLGVDVFLSYSRKDADFVRSLHGRLQEAGFTVWFDQEHIAASTDFRQEIFRAINEADNIVFVASPDAVGSAYCEEEVEHAKAQNKRIHIVLHREAALPETLKNVDWVDCSADDWSGAFDELAHALRTDREHAAAHTELQARAKLWSEQRQSDDLLLNRSACEMASSWLSAGICWALPAPRVPEAEKGVHGRLLWEEVQSKKAKDPAPTEIQVAYVAASRVALAAYELEQNRKNALLRRRLRWLRVALGVALLALAGASWSAKRATNKEREARRAKQEAEHQADAAKDAKSEAQHQAQRSNAVSLGALATEQLHAENTGRAVALAYQGYATRADLPVVETAMFEVQQALFYEQSPAHFQVFRHERSIDRVAWSPQGELLATPSNDHTVGLWTGKGSAVARLRAKDRVVNAVFFPDGSKLVTSGAGGTVQLWSSEGTLLKNLAGAKCPKESNCEVFALGVAPDGQSIAGGGVNRDLLIWDSKGELQKSVPASPRHSRYIRTLSFAPDGQHILVAWAGGRSGRVVSYSVDGQEQWALDAKCAETHEWDCRASVAAAPDSSRWAVALPDRSIRLYAPDGRLIHQVESAHDGAINALAYQPSGEHFVSGANDHEAVLWSANGGRIATLKGHSKGVRTVAFSPDGKLIATGSDDSTARLWGLDGQLLRTFEGHRDSILSLSFSPDGRTLVTASKDKTAKMWRIAALPSPVILDEKGTEAAALLSATRALTLATIKSENAARVRAQTWTRDDAGEWKRESVIEDHADLRTGLQGRIMSLDLASTGQHFVTTGPDDVLRVWDIPARSVHQVSRDFSGDSGGWYGPLNARFSPDGSWLAVTDHGGQLKILAAKDGSTPPTMESVPHQGPVLAVDISPDGRLMATGGHDQQIHLYRRAGSRWTLRHTLEGHSEPITSLQFAPDGQRLVSAARDYTVRLWAVSGALLSSQKQSQQVEHVAFSLDGNRIVSAGRTEAVIWSADLSKLYVWTAADRDIRSIHFSPDERSFILAADDHRARIWMTGPGFSRWVEEEVPFRLSCDERREFGLVEGCH